MPFGRVYQITNDITNSCYIGSTCAQLKARFAKHKSAAITQTRQCLLYEEIRNNPNAIYSISLLEEFQFNEKIELRQREQFYIRQRGTLNKICAYIDAERQRERKEERRAYINDYRSRLSGSFVCDCCSVSFTRKTGLNAHLTTKRHNNNQ